MCSFLLSILGGGDFSIWEYSGYEPYYMLYDHFIGDINCIHTIVFNINDSPEVQKAQVFFWLNFIKGRLLPQEPIGKQPSVSERVIPDSLGHMTGNALIS